MDAKMMEIFMKHATKFRGEMILTEPAAMKAMDEYAVHVAKNNIVLSDVSGQLPPPDCSKCGRSGYSSGKPFCTDDFCNSGNLR